MRVAVVGATGLVGTTLLKVLEQRHFPVSELIPVASERSVGKVLMFKGQPFTVVSMDTAIEMRPDIAIFSAGGSTSTTFAPKFAEVGTTVIDNSSAWRMDPTKKLIVPEVAKSFTNSLDFQKRIFEWTPWVIADLISRLSDSVASRKSARRLRMMSS